jgi:hypothetical protein
MAVDGGTASKREMARSSNGNLQRQDGGSPSMVVRHHGRRQQEAAAAIVVGGGGDCQREVATDRTAVSAGRRGRCHVLCWRTVRLINPQREKINQFGNCSISLLIRDCILSLLPAH